jgi:hypothetical protein
MISNSEDSDSRRSFPAVLCLVAILVVGLIVCGVFWVQRVGEDVRRRNVIKQLGLAIVMYANDYDDRLPPAGRWAQAIRPYFNDDADLGGCEGIPSESGLPCGYCFNEADSGKKISAIDKWIGMVWESPASAAAKGNILYWNDGHGEDNAYPWPINGQLPPK